MKIRRYRSTRMTIAIIASAVSVVLIGACTKPAPPEAQGGASQPAAARGSGGQTGGQYGRRQSVIPVEVATVQVGLLSADRETAGVVSPVTQSQVAAQVAGVVQKLFHLSGDWVKTGDPIVQLDDSQLRLGVANADAALENAKINLAVGEDNANQANPKLSLQVQSAQSALDSAQKYYDSQKALYALGGISASQLDSASSQLTAAQANLEGAKTALDQNQKSGDWNIAQLKLAVTQAQNALQQARLNLQYASIRAPFSGQIAAINVQPGMYVGLNTSVLTLVSAAREIAFSVAPPDAPAVPVGTRLTFDFNGKDYPIRVSQAPSAPVSGVIPLVATAIGPFDLPFGAVGNVTYRVGVARGAMLPIAALATLENQNFVFLVENGKAVVQNVSIVGEAGITAVVDGLVDGSQVIVSPPPGMLQGSPVQIVTAGQSSVTSGAGTAAGAPPAAPAGARTRTKGGQSGGAGSLQGQGAPQGGTSTSSSAGKP